MLVIMSCSGKPRLLRILRGSWDLVTTYRPPQTDALSISLSLSLSLSLPFSLSIRLCVYRYTHVCICMCVRATFMHDAIVSSRVGRLSEVFAVLKLGELLKLSKRSVFKVFEALKLSKFAKFKHFQNCRVSKCKRSLNFFEFLKTLKIWRASKNASF